MFNIAELYRTHWKRKLFNKILIIYSGITILSLASLSVFVFKYFADTSIRNDLDFNKQVLEHVGGYLDAKYVDSLQVMQQLYLEKTMLDDVLYFLEHDFGPYISYRLDRYAKSADTKARNMNTFFRFRMDDDPDIHSILLYSNSKKFAYIMKPNEYQRYYPFEQGAGVFAPPGSAAGPPRFMQTEEMQGLQAIVQNNHVLTTVSAINDPSTQQNVGNLVINYDINGMFKSFRNMGREIKGYIVVLTKDGQVLFDSSNRYYGGKYPYWSELHTADGKKPMEEPSYVNVNASNNSGFLIAGIMPESEVRGADNGLKNTLILTTSLCTLAALSITFFTIKHFSRRTKTIIQAMKKLQNGDLTVRIPMEKEDELFEISTRFNQMCADLSEYIDRVYASEITKKQAELVAFQAQIKPHFLYNTLEAIRMRAIAKKAHDVSDMIYILGTLLQYSIKSGTVISLSDEIEYCKRYLDLFRIRHKYKFSYHVEIEPELAERPIVKLTLQPIVENYIMHGIRLKRDDNLISIAAELAGQDLCITVRDNGNGIAPEKLEQIRRMLERRDPHSSKSIGLTNVHERLKTMFGERYGLRIDSRLGSGTSVTMILPAMKAPETEIAAAAYKH
ncbi:hypothetical protein PAE9249_00616 [Paenibacillus sp. CECT 9249]|uniref:sensor histidine kinase n=1 Tax=Paenibacillus sp. CECT 9249 TaxID=2845385 RepID=UPI001E53CA86|nr:histidine kinase [Paenibacillus sp. CECT 9249]CAH0118150.1 hypothetical protein PAE9249_00616 [Paenibacillus sp. CECT 9249]